MRFDRHESGARARLDAAVRIVLARHGQSEWQRGPSDNWDTPLSAIGKEQSRLLGAWLAGHRSLDGAARLDVDVLVSSPLVRARQTAECLSSALALPVTELPTLREAAFHVIDELPTVPDPLEPSGGDPGGPSARYLGFREQVRHALQALVGMAGGGPTVLAVTHGGLIKTLLRIVLDTDLVCFRIYNAGLNVIEWEGSRWRIVHLNLWDHLPPELRTS